MKKWQISDIRWATSDDLNLPFWKKWNKENPLPDNFWQRIWEYPYAALHVPSSGQVIDVGGTYPFVLFKSWPNAISVDNRDLNKVDHPLLKGLWPKGKLLVSDARKIPVKSSSYDYSISISAIEEMPNTVKVLKEMIRIAKHRIVVTMDISEELGVNRPLLRELEDLLGQSLPPIPHNVLTSVNPAISNFGQALNPSLKHIRVLGITIDSLDTPKDIGILIPHWESYEFADSCLRGIKKYRNPSLNEHIYLLDDESLDGSFEKLKQKYGKDKTISLIRIRRDDRETSADVGALLDKGLEHVKEQFTTMVDADTMPLSRDWLSFPIWLIEKYRLSMAGLDTGLSSAYTRFDQERWWQPESGYSIRGGIYDNNWFMIVNNLYRVMRTATAKVVSEHIGFTRGIGSIPLTNKIVNKVKRTMGLKTEQNPRAPYLPAGCDNGVAANHFVDINRMGPKFNIPLTSYIGLTKADGAYGQNISDLIFHFALSTRALSKTRREVYSPGEEYMYWIKQMMESHSLSTKLMSKMIKASRVFRRGGYDGSVPVKWYKDEYAYMQEIIAEYHKDLVG